MLNNPLNSVFCITDEMRDAYLENARFSVQLSRKYEEACGATDDFWDSIEDEPLAPDAQITEETP